MAGYHEDVKGYTIIHPNSKGIIIRRDVKFNENVLTCEPDSTYVSSLACKSNLVVLFSSYSFLNNTPSYISSDTNSDDQNPPLHVSPPVLAHMTTSQLPGLVHSTQ